MSEATDTRLDALSAGEVMAEHFNLARSALAEAIGMSKYDAGKAHVQVEIANAHIRLAELAWNVKPTYGR